MSQGTPVVGTRGGGVPEIIEHGMSGFMYEIGNIDELGHYIRQVLDDQVIWTLFSLNGQERAREMFSIKQTSHKVQQIYKELLARPGVEFIERQQAKEIV